MISNQLSTLTFLWWASDGLWTSNTIPPWPSIMSDVWDPLFMNQFMIKSFFFLHVEAFPTTQELAGAHHGHIAPKTSSIWVKSCTTKPVAACQCRNSTQYKVVTFCDRCDDTVSENIYFKFIVNVMWEPVPGSTLLQLCPLARLMATLLHEGENMFFVKT